MAHTGDLVAETLARYGTPHVFSLPGGQTTALYDNIARRPPRIQHMLVRDERSTGYAADPYACLMGRSDVCDVTVGPSSSASCLATGRLYATWASPRRASTIDTETSEEEFPESQRGLRA